MTRSFIYLDESGDLGWKFHAPYRQGGSSRYLTIAAIIVSEQSANEPARGMRRLYKKFKWPTGKEKKWAHMMPEERAGFAEMAKRVAAASDGGIKYVSITVKKENVSAHIRPDPNKLYNFMIKMLLLDEMSKVDEVLFFPDDRSIKVKSGNSLGDYLQTELWFSKEVATVLKTYHCDSSKNLCVQFADMLSGIAQSHYQDRTSEPYRLLAAYFQPRLIFNN
ncbi:DUF3800 domain-containing protein [Pseudomonas savastanoi]|uniref:DUF3800 domain-containing protein n=1 Tax=Pseudomonas savastanoi TaxID=29438 RepID=UPI0017835ACB|nr:DUF3800 domain-containing protein [Pseudomonas savastanoi]QOI04580.1 DUF3800 domain-containing protein [Pseudomonas savastanoi]